MGHNFCRGGSVIVSLGDEAGRSLYLRLARDCRCSGGAEFSRGELWEYAYGSREIGREVFGSFEREFAVASLVIYILLRCVCLWGGGGDFLLLDSRVLRAVGGRAVL